MNFGLPELLFIFVIALLIFGPRKLPEISRQIGHALAEYKRATNSLKGKWEAEVRNLEDTSNTHPSVQSRISEADAKQPAAGVLEEAATVTAAVGAELVDIEIENAASILPLNDDAGAAASPSSPEAADASPQPNCDLLRATLQNLPELRTLSAAETPNRSEESAVAAVGELMGGANGSPRAG